MVINGKTKKGKGEEANGIGLKQKKRKTRFLSVQHETL